MFTRYGSLELRLALPRCAARILFNRVRTYDTSIFYTIALELLPVDSFCIRATNLTKRPCSSGRGLGHNVNCGIPVHAYGRRHWIPISGLERRTGWHIIHTYMYYCQYLMHSPLTAVAAVASHSPWPSSSLISSTSGVGRYKVHNAVCCGARTQIQEDCSLRGHRDFGCSCSNAGCSVSREPADALHHMQS